MSGLAPDPHVVVTRAEASDGPLSSQLRSLGARVLLWPTIEVAPSDDHALEAALEHIADFDWIVFTSRQAAPPVLERLPKQPPNLKVAACRTSDSAGSAPARLECRPRSRRPERRRIGRRLRAART